MSEAEFDRFAGEYRQLHAENIRVSGERPEFFAEYKVRDVARLARASGFANAPAILDFGAGVGNSVGFFRQYLPGCRLTCLDASRKSLDVASERFPDAAEFVAYDGGEIPLPPEQFDVVFAACVFHHIPTAEHEPVLQQLYRVTRRSGLLVIFEHNPYNPLTVRAVNTCVFDENAVLIPAGTLVRRVRRAGFSSAKPCYRIFFPGMLRVLRGLERGLGWLPLGAQYYVSARRA